MRRASPSALPGGARRPAASMTGAVAFAVGMPALFGAPEDLGRRLLAPPSSLQRTVRAPALSGPARRPGAGRLAGASSTGKHAQLPVTGPVRVLSPQP